MSIVRTTKSRTKTFDFFLLYLQGTKTILSLEFSSRSIMVTILIWTRSPSKSSIVESAHTCKKNQIFSPTFNCSDYSLWNFTI